MPVYMHDDFCNMPGALFLICSYTLPEDAIETHWARRACALCARPPCAVTTLCTPPAKPWALGDHAVNRRSELLGSAVARRGRSTERPLSPCVCRDISTLWKMWNYSLYFLVFLCDPTALWEISNRRANTVGSRQSVTGALTTLRWIGWMDFHHFQDNSAMAQGLNGTILVMMRSTPWT